MKRTQPVENERTRNVYEEIKGYAKPPLIPLPESKDLSSLDKLGIKPGKFSHGIVKAAMVATGFKAFQKQLPNHLETILRRSDMRGGGLFAPVISATLMLRDDPRKLTPVARAATLVCAARRLWKDITTGTLEPDRLGDQVLEMGQHPNLFSTCLICDGKKPKIFKSTNVSQIIVLISGRFYFLNISKLDPETAPELLEDALSRLVQLHSEKGLEDRELSPGILTAASNKIQQKAFSRLQRININRDSLNIIRHSFLILCLDFDLKPSSDAEAAKIGHIGNCANRWYHSSLQLVVFGNSKACAICNFSTYEINGIGKTFFIDHQIAPVPAFILALQMTANHFVGKTAKITQFLSMSKYRCMDLINVDVTTAEVSRFVDYMIKEDMQHDIAKKLLQEAIESQKLECRRSRKYLNIPAMLTYFFRSKRGLECYMLFS